jgi:Zn-dependent M28 family amino/carboxypeptidase
MAAQLEPTVTVPPIGSTAPQFDTANARGHVAALAGIGVRREGSSNEWRGVTYVRDRLEAMGYDTTLQHVPLPGGRVSHNVIAVKRGVTSRRFVLGAHLDTKSPSPGANDNASGCGVLLELARVFQSRGTAPTLVFVVFGAEEMSDSNPDHHHYGSRTYVKSLSSAQRRNVCGMVSVDMVGYGSHFTVGNMERGPMTLVNSLRTFANTHGTAMTFNKDLGRYGWSDHEPFELAGIPAAWIEWRTDPVYHTSRDVASHVQDSRLRATGRLLEDYVGSLKPRDLDRLRR